MKKLMKILIIILGAALILYSIGMAITSNFNMGIVITLVLGIFLVLAPKLYTWINSFKNRTLATIIKCIIIAILGFFIFMISMLIFYGGNDTTTYDEDVLIVLGSGIKGETVSAGLKKRLDKAVEYWEANPSAIIIVSGGQGPQEDVTEAYAMKLYLVNAGIPERTVVMEESATSTYENFMYSKEIIENLFVDDYTVAYITNSFHIYRGGLVAKNVGIPANSLSTSTEWSSIPMVYSREVLAVLKYWVLGY